MIPILGDLLSGGVSKVIDSVSDAVGKFVTTDKEREALNNELMKIKSDALLESQKIALDTQKAYLSDMQDARSMNTRIEESANASWLSKNIAPALAIGSIGLCFFMILVLLFGNYVGILVADKNLSNMICVGLFNVMTIIMSFYFGSSQSSRAKDDYIQGQLQKAT